MLDASALRHDIGALPAGDETVIGLKGVKSSGGQRARLALARALYSSAQLLVLDDVFSALDYHVARKVLDGLTGDLGIGRTRILVTHNVALCLPRARYFIILEDRTISFEGSPDLLGDRFATIETKTRHSQDLIYLRRNGKEVQNVLRRVCQT